MVSAFSEEKEAIMKQVGLSEDAIREKKFVVVGNKGCGKSSFMQCFLMGNPLYHEFKTSEPIRKTIGSNDQVLNLVFCETPSSDSEFDINIRALAYPDSAGVFLCFAIDDRQSFLEIPKWHEEAKKYAPNAKFFVIGCKMDTRVDDGPVGRKEGKAMSKSLRAVKYYECSAVVFRNFL
ncbi:uncharacterized protein TNCT_558921 [Trichonephila clavata]|uniref:Uncharacterized protein n=1 Tax=Trichonephila clavata TaxID=2740835 RepID=A0A8X6M2J4_TRICU|nr:uncharacterized protein TNCT_558921 [Trichonephila clavata]